MCIYMQVEIAGAGGIERIIMAMDGHKSHNGTIYIYVLGCIYLYVYITSPTMVRIYITSPTMVYYKSHNGIYMF